MGPGGHGRQTYTHAHAHRTSVYPAACVAQHKQADTGTGKQGCAGRWALFTYLGVDGGQVGGHEGALLAGVLRSPALGHAALGAVLGLRGSGRRVGQGVQWARDRGAGEQQTAEAAVWHCSR